MAASVTATGNRRAFERLGRSAHQIDAARIRPAREAAVVDISPGGASVEVCFRLLPGSPVELQVDRPGHRIDLKGRVIRCVVARLHASAVTYRAAIAFDREWPDLLAPRPAG